LRVSLSIFLILLCQLVLGSNLSAADPDQYTKLLIHSDSTNGSTQFVDASSNPHPITAYGNVNHSTSVQQVGATSIYFDGYGDYLSTPNSPDWDFGTDNFTVEFWLYPTSSSLSGVRLFLGTYAPGQYKGWTIGIVNGKLAFSADTNGVPSWDVRLEDPNSLVSDTWYHCLVVRNADEWSLIKNGTVVDSSQVSGALYPSGARLEIGESYSSYQFIGYLDEIHISKGIDRQSQLPAKPTVTGGVVFSGTIQPRPAANTTDRIIAVLEGTRENGTSVWINGELIEPLGSGPWAHQIQLNPGDNAYEIYCRNSIGNQSASEWVDINFNGQGGIIYEYDAAGRMKRVQTLP